MCANAYCSAHDRSVTNMARQRLRNSISRCLLSHKGCSADICAPNSALFWATSTLTACSLWNIDYNNKFVRTFERRCGTAVAAHNHILYAKIATITANPLACPKHFVVPRRRRTNTLCTQTTIYNNRSARMFETTNCGGAAAAHKYMIYTTYKYSQHIRPHG